MISQLLKQVDYLELYHAMPTLTIKIYPEMIRTVVVAAVPSPKVMANRERRASCPAMACSSKAGAEIELQKGRTDRTSKLLLLLQQLQQQFPCHLAKLLFRVPSEYDSLHTHIPPTVSLVRL